MGVHFKSLLTQNFSSHSYHPCTSGQVNISLVFPQEPAISWPCPCSDKQLLFHQSLCHVVHRCHSLHVLPHSRFTHSSAKLGSLQPSPDPRFLKSWLHPACCKCCQTAWKGWQWDLCRAQISPQISCTVQRILLSSLCDHPSWGPTQAPGADISMQLKVQPSVKCNISLRTCSFPDCKPEAVQRINSTSN